MSRTETAPTYNLGAITRETGLNADTLRAWERRYKLPQPARSAGGQRLYSPRDLEILKWLIARQEEGMRISQAAKMWHSQIDAGVDPLKQIAEAKTNAPVRLIMGENINALKSQWVSACISFNEVEAEQIISEAFSHHSPEAVCFDVLFAGLSEIGEAWYRGDISVQQEHFASALVARRLNALIAGAPLPNRPQKIVVAAPPNEEHILSPLLITFLLRRRGWDVLYLGADVPLENFKTTIKSLHPDLVILTAQQLHTSASLLELANDLSDLKIPLAFGGLIFNELPALQARIPGYFLGEELENAVFNIEQHLQNPSAKIKVTQPKTAALSEQFRAVLPNIESRVYEDIKSHTELQTTPYRYLSRDILAALKLGDTAFLNSDLNWVLGLLSNSQIPKGALGEFLQIYHRAVHELLGQSAEPVLTWLQTEIDRLSGKKTST